MRAWNQALRVECANNQGYGVFLLDYWERLTDKNSSNSHRVEYGGVGDDPSSAKPEYVLNKYYNADYTHMNSAFLPLLEDALEACPCDKECI